MLLVQFYQKDICSLTGRRRRLVDRISQVSFDKSKEEEPLVWLTATDGHTGGFRFVNQDTRYQK